MTRKILFISFTSKEERWVLVLGGRVWNTRRGKSCRFHFGAVRWKSGLECKERERSGEKSCSSDSSISGG